MLQIVVNNSKRSEEIEFRSQVLKTMTKQVLKKIIGQENGSRLSKSCDAPFNKSNSIEQKKETV